MDGLKKWADSAVGWKMLDEPFWKWCVFTVALTGAMVAWKGVLRHMDG